MDVMSLWLPILAASVAVFFVSFFLWMVSPHHKADIQMLKDEPAMVDFLSKASIPGGMYMWPNCESNKEMNTEEFKAKVEKGPWGMLIVRGGKPNFGVNLTATFLWYVLISVLVAYITGQARSPGASFGAVFQIATTAGVLGYAMGSFPNQLFFGIPNRFKITNVLDAILYAIVTGLAFALLWPGIE